MRGYGDQLDVQVDEVGQPLAFRWRGRRYQVVEYLTSWQDRTSWWRQGGNSLLLEESVWRVEAGAGTRRGVFELRGANSCWTLVGVLD